MITVALYNLKGGVGKTTTAVNLAYLAAQAKRNTVLWDWDPQGAASWYLCADNAEKKAIKVVNKGLPVGALEVSSPYRRLSVIPADLSLRNLDIALSDTNGARKFIRKMVEPLGENASIVIFDCPPSLSPSVEYLLSGVDIVLVPMIPSPLSVRAAEQVQTFFKGKKRAPENVVGFFNMVDMRRNIHKAFIAGESKMPIAMLKTFVPMDAAAEAMAARRAPLVSYAGTTRAASSYRQMWKEIIRLVKAKKR